MTVRALLIFATAVLLVALAACTDSGDPQTGEAPPEAGTPTPPSEVDDSPAGGSQPGDHPEGASDEEAIGASETDGEGVEAGEETGDGTLVARIDSGGLPFELSASTDEGQVCATFVAGEGEDERCDWPTDPDDHLLADVLTVDGMQTVFAVVADDVDAVEVVGATDSTTRLEVLDLDDGARVAGGPPPDAQAVSVVALDDGGDEVARVDL